MRSRNHQAPAHLARWRLSLVLISALLTLASAPPAAAQGELRRFFPDEITVDDLDRYSRYLDLSEAQATAVRAFHQEYRERFAQLRQEKIDAHDWPTELPETHAAWLSTMERFQRETEAIRNQIRLVDRTLFAEVETILDESQLAGMRRARDHRERRTLYVASILAVTQRQFHDLSWLAEEKVELPDDDAALVDSVLVDYERQLTALLRQLHDAAHAMEYESYRESVRRGHGDESVRETDQEEWRSIYRFVWERKGRKTIDLAIAIDTLNRATSSRIVRTISPEGGHLWRDVFLREFYPGAAGPRRERRKLLIALDRADNLDETDRESFRTIFAGFEVALFDVERRLIAAEGPYRDRRPIGYGPNEKDPVQDQYLQTRSELHAELKERIDQLLTQVSASLSPNGWVTFDTAYAAVMKRPRPDRPAHPGGAVIQTLARAPLFLQPRDLQRLSRLLDLGDEQRALLDEAFEGYGRRRAAIEADLPPAASNKYRYESLLSAELQQRLRQAGESVVGVLDRMLDTDALRRRLSWLRQARRRAALGYATAPRVAGGLDIALFVLDSNLPDEDIERIADLLDEYDARALPLYRRMHETYRTHYEWFIVEYQDDNILPLIRPWMEAQTAVAALNAETMMTIGGMLQSDEATAMLDLFTGYCYGPVFDDPDAAQPWLDRAKRIDDLTVTQRDSILDLQVGHRAAYDQLTNAMLADARSTIHWSYDNLRNNRNRSPSGGEERESYRRHRFERDELNASTIAQLRSILSEAQFESIGGGDRD